MTREELHHLENVLVEKINRINPVILKKYPVRELLELFNHQSTIEEYSYVNKKVAAFDEALFQETRAHRHVIGIYYNLVLLSCIRNSRERIVDLQYPQPVLEEFERRFDRIFKKTAAWSDDFVYYPLKDDKYLKSLAICRLHTIPLGAQYIERGNLSRIFLFLHGIPQFVRGCWYVIRLGGFSPYYKMSTNQLDPELIANFNPAGWEKLLLLAGELMKKERPVKGIIGRSWFFDPQLEIIDQDIVYIRHLFIQAGAVFFYHKAEPQVIKDAIFLSQKRKKLYEEKKYHPRSYLVILPRKKLLHYLEQVKKKA